MSGSLEGVVCAMVAGGGAKACWSFVAENGVTDEILCTVCIIYI